MTSPIDIPADVQHWLRSTFASCNEHVSAVMTRVPTIYETSLDMAFIEHFASMAVPFRFPSGYVVEISTHYLGGGRHFWDWPEHMPRAWEIADIGFLVMFRQAGHLVRSKVALLQSKRLYPDEQDWDEDNPLDYVAGFGRLLRRDEDWASISAARQFGFTCNSRYKALVKGIGQYTAIAQYEQQRGIPVYYLLYHPWQVPHSVVLPLSAESPSGGGCDVGCRIVPASRLRTAIGNRPDGHSPAYDELRESLDGPFASDMHRGGWRLEHFVVDELIECNAGYVAASPSDGGLNYVFARRGRPIAAAIALTIDAP